MNSLKTLSKENKKLYLFSEVSFLNESYFISDFAFFKILIIFVAIICDESKPISSK